MRVSPPVLEHACVRAAVNSMPLYTSSRVTHSLGDLTSPLPAPYLTRSVAPLTATMQPLAVAIAFAASSASWLCAVLSTPLMLPACCHECFEACVCVFS